MKLASLKSKTSRDGQLCVVNRALTHAFCVPNIAPTLQYALEQWRMVEEALQAVYSKLNAGELTGAIAFNPQEALSPLPRAYQWLDGSAYLNHVELVRKARGAEMPEQFLTDPLMYQGGSDAFLGPRENIVATDEAFGIDFEAEVAIITDDVPMGIAPSDARQYIRLVMLVNDVTLRNLIPAELAKGFGFLQSKPASSFSPVAVTPDELMPHWDGERLHLPLQSYLNGALFGEPNAGKDMVFSFPALIAHAAKTRTLTAGTIIGSGTVSNASPSVGSSCIVERRMLETIEQGRAITPYLSVGDTLRIDMQDEQGHSIFGVIEQTVVVP